ncbi:MAG: phosphoglycolate phosphatase [Pseudomonadota bacterium]
MDDSRDSAGGLRAALFDLDGTLIDSVPGLWHAMTALLAELGLPEISQDEMTGYTGHGIPTLVKGVLGRTGVPSPEHFDAALKRFNEIYIADPLKGSALYPGVVALLAALRADGWALGVCTNKPIAPTNVILRESGLAPRFNVVVGGDTLPTRKPDPAPVHHALAALCAEPSRAVFVGDTDIDAEAAARAGVPFCLFTQGYGGDVGGVDVALRFDAYSTNLNRSFDALVA